VASGLFALLDDIAAIAKVAAASLDDAAAQAAKAGSKAAGIVIDDAAVTPRYVVGFAAERELPIIRQIAAGSLKNKLLFLTPGALLLSAFARPLITPLLMAGGAFLCLEGYHKVHDLLHPKAGDDASEDPAAQGDAMTQERAKVASAVRTDFILSAEIMAITLATVSTAPMGVRVAVLVSVGVAMTVLVYGVVAIIVKADDAGAALARSPRGVVRAVGRGLVQGMPGFLKLLSMVGLVAMLWVGGGIVVHGLHELGVHGPEEVVTAAGWRAGRAVPAAAGVLQWVVTTAISAVLGLALGAVIGVLVDRVFAPLVKALRRRRG
jgi:predicted DNA repair protein MutK